jgi:hypothetical protein
MTEPGINRLRTVIIALGEPAMTVQFTAAVVGTLDFDDGARREIGPGQAVMHDYPRAAGWRDA